MPGAAANDLLRALSWRAEKLLRKRGHFNTVQFLTEDANGHGLWFETNCASAPDTATDKEVLTGLAADVALDFAAAGVVRFACAYLCKRVTVIRPLDPDASMKPRRRATKPRDERASPAAPALLAFFRSSPVPL